MKQAPKSNVSCQSINLHWKMSKNLPCGWQSQQGASDPCLQVLFVGQQWLTWILSSAGIYSRFKQ